MSKMTPAEAAEILRQHNAWRRDNDDEAPLERVHPIRLGKAIDVAVAHLLLSGERGGAEVSRKEGHEPDCNLNMASIKRQFMGCDCKLSAPSQKGRPPAQAAQVDGKIAKLLRDVRAIYIGSERPSGDGCDAETWDRIEAAISSTPAAEPVAQGEAADDLAMHLACEHGETDEAGTGYSFSMEQFDAFIHAFVAAQPRAVPYGWFARGAIEDAVEKALNAADVPMLYQFAIMNGIAESLWVAEKAERNVADVLAATPSPGESQV